MGITVGYMRAWINNGHLIGVSNGHIILDFSQLGVRHGIGNNSGTMFGTTVEHKSGATERLETGTTVVHFLRGLCVGRVSARCSGAGVTMVGVGLGTSVGQELGTAEGCTTVGH